MEYNTAINQKLKPFKDIIDKADYKERRDGPRELWRDTDKMKEAKGEVYIAEEEIEKY